MFDDGQCVQKVGWRFKAEQMPKSHVHHVIQTTGGKGTSMLASALLIMPNGNATGFPDYSITCAGARSAPLLSNGDILMPRNSLGLAHTIHCPASKAKICPRGRGT